jgi:hypothetical protein
VPHREIGVRGDRLRRLRRQATAPSRRPRNWAVAMVVIDPANRTTWPADVVVEVERLASICREQPSNTLTTNSQELSLGHLEATFEADTAFRRLLEGRLVSLFHATRLLPHEREAVREEGLVVLDERHRSKRVDRVIEIYGADCGVSRLEHLRHAGPLTWNSAHRRGRLGVLHGVTPLKAAFDGAGSGMTIFLSHWGGESFYWANLESVALGETIALLTKRSAPAIVEVGSNRIRSIPTACCGQSSSPKSAVGPYRGKSSRRGCPCRRSAFTPSWIRRRSVGPWRPNTQGRRLRSCFG